MKVGHGTIETKTKQASETLKQKIITGSVFLVVFFLLLSALYI